MTSTSTLRNAITARFNLRTESVSMISSRYSKEYPTNAQIAVVLPDPKFAVNAPLRERDEETLLDLLTTPNSPVVEIDRTATRVFLAVL